MGLLDWVKRRGKSENAFESPQPERGAQEISAFWLPAPYKVPSSGYLVQPCVGWSEKGYHPGLTVAAPGGDAVTSWGEQFKEKGHAKAAAYSAFTGWLGSHEAEMDSRERDARSPSGSRNTADAKVQQPDKGRSWER